jgi:hypothetical protein
VARVAADEAGLGEARLEEEFFAELDLGGIYLGL